MQEDGMSTVDKPTLVTRLRTAIDRKEQLARAARPEFFTQQVLCQFAAVGDAVHVYDNRPSEVLRGCAADRKLVSLHLTVGQTRDDEPPMCMECSNEWPCDTLHIAAERYGIAPMSRR